jgi:menaquinone-9 beta-reductase
MSELASSVDVLVVGGGPAGLAAAMVARRYGLSVVVADGAAPPIDKACGEGLMPEGVEALHRLGITLPEREVHPFYGVRFINEGETAEARFPRGPAYGIRRTRLHQILLERAAGCGVEMLWRTPVTELASGGDFADAMVGGKRLRARWIVGADGKKSRVRSWAKMDAPRLDFSGGQKIRYGFRRHYRIAPWTDFMELYWGGRDSESNDSEDRRSPDQHSGDGYSGDQCQVYVTPVGRDEVGVALLSSNPKIRVDDALQEFPQLQSRLARAEVISLERGATTGNQKFQRVVRGHCALVGDASGGVDAITGEGLALAFEQAFVLGECLVSGDLQCYQRVHRRLSRRPLFMARMMTLLAKHQTLRRRAMRVFRSNPSTFARLLAMHVGEDTTWRHVANGIGFAWAILQTENTLNAHAAVKVGGNPGGATEPRAGEF